MVALLYCLVDRWGFKFNVQELRGSQLVSDYTLAKEYLTKWFKHLLAHLSHSFPRDFRLRWRWSCDTRREPCDACDPYQEPNLRWAWGRSLHVVLAQQRSNVPAIHSKVRQVPLGLRQLPLWLLYYKQRLCFLCTHVGLLAIHSLVDCSWYFWWLLLHKRLRCNAQKEGRIQRR